MHAFIDIYVSKGVLSLARDYRGWMFFFRSGMGVTRPGLLKPSNYFVLLKKTEL